MALVVFMRGVNVGGHKAFRPAALAKELAEFDLVNVGAAGTYVVRSKVSQRVLRAELLRRLPFEAELVICPAQELTKLVSADPFPREASIEGVRRFVSVLAKRPPTLPSFPLSHPPDGQWQVKLVALHGRFALSLWRRLGARLIYPNEVVEKHLAVAATTRTWDTIAKMHAILHAG